MAFKVVVLPFARADLIESTDFILGESRERARRWYDGAWRAIFSLADAPMSFAIIPEADEIGARLRQTHYHSHRIVFRVDEEREVVQVLRIVHGSQRPLRPSGLP